MKHWSPEQKKIFAWFETGSGNLIVRARAGTGKTTTIIEGAERSPEAKPGGSTRVLLAAFNKNIQLELEKRIKSSSIYAKTLHSLGFSSLMRNWPEVRVSKADERQAALALQVCGERTLEEVLILVGQIHTKMREIFPLEATPAKTLELMVDFDLLPDDEMVESGFSNEWVADRAAEAVELAADRQFLVQAGCLIDFADMIYLPLRHNMVRPAFDLVVVDEAQDMTVPQLQLAIRSCRKGGRIAIVGDDRQAIYGFRGADSGSLDRLKGVLNAPELGLTTTYRCPKRVVEIAAAYVPDFRAADSASEGIVEHSNQDSMIDSAGPSDFILSRTNAPLVRVCLSFLKHGKRAIVRGRDIGKGIRALVNRQKADNLFELRVKLDTWKDREYKKAANLPPRKADARLEFVCDQHEVVESIADNCSTLPELKTSLDALFSDNNLANSVVCSTVHKAKGQEADNVFLLEDTFFRRKPRDGEEQREEENIMYVAVTRSKGRLVYVPIGVKRP